MDPRITDEGEFDKGREHSRNATKDRAHRPERLPMSTACAWIHKARLQLQLATIDSKAHHSVLSYTLNRTSRDTVRSEDDRLYQATIDRNGLACGDEVVLIAGCPYLVLTSKDDG
jgi:hypothetical protein